jgi:hypothetical protein
MNLGPRGALCSLKVKLAPKDVGTLTLGSTSPPGALGCTHVVKTSLRRFILTKKAKKAEKSFPTQRNKFGCALVVWSSGGVSACGVMGREIESRRV